MKKKNIVKNKEKETAFYVGVSNPNDIRKTMLETSKELLVSLKQYEHLRDIRTQKSALYSQYTAQINTVKTLINKLQRAIPKHDLSHLVAKKQQEYVKPEPVVIEREKEEAPVVEKFVKPSDEVSRLEAELAEIEKKLAGM